MCKTLRGLLQIIAKLLRPRRVTQLRQRLRLDLPDPLAGNPELLADLLQRPRVPVDQAEPQLDDLLLPVGQRVQDRVELLLQEDEGGGIDRYDGVAVLDEVAEVGVLLLTDRRLERDRLLRQLEDLAHPLRRELHLVADLLRSRFAPEVLQQLSLDAHELVDRLDHVHGNADRARLVRDRAGDRLPDPPRRVGRELVALGVVELLDRADQAEVALLDQVEEQHAAADVALRDRHHEPQVGLDQALLGELPVALDQLEVAAQAGADRALRRQLLRSEEAGLDAFREVDLFLCGEERYAPDLLQVHPYRVVRRRLQRRFLFGRRGARGRLVLEVVLGRLDDLDALVADESQDRVHRLRRKFRGRHRSADVLRREEPGLLASGHEVSYLVDQRLARKRSGAHPDSVP